MKICKVCGVEKKLNDYYKNGNYYRGTCKICWCIPLRTGKENTGRFKKGNIPWIKGKTGFQPWNKGIPALPNVKEALQEGKKNHILTEKQKQNIKNGKIKASLKRRTKGRHGWFARDWRDKVKERDNWECQHCGLKDRDKLESHHIIPWHKSEELRFDLNNGITLCRSCHSKEDRRINPIAIIPKGSKLTVEHKKKLSEAKKGKAPWNKGLKLNKQ